MSVTADQLRERIRTAFSPVHLEITDTSGGCGASFETVIVSSQFEGKTLLARHRLVNEALKAEIAELHAFSQKTFTPEQWEKQKQK